MAIISVSVWQTILRFWFLKLHSLNQQIILLHRLMGLFEYLFMFWLKRHLPAKQALNKEEGSRFRHFGGFELDFTTFRY